VLKKVVLVFAQGPISASFLSAEEVGLRTTKHHLFRRNGYNCELISGLQL